MGYFWGMVYGVDGSVAHLVQKSNVCLFWKYPPLYDIIHIMTYSSHIYVHLKIWLLFKFFEHYFYFEFKTIQSSNYPIFKLFDSQTITLKLFDIQTIHIQLITIINTLNDNDSHYQTQLITILNCLTDNDYHY